MNGSLEGGRDLSWTSIHCGWRTSKFCATRGCNMSLAKFSGNHSQTESVNVHADEAGQFCI